jgi:hypothetical protein
MSRASFHRGGEGSRGVTYGYEIDPCAILGVAPGASLDEIREAYRAKARKHHPDHGGDEWAFRIVVRSYEVLSAARVAGRAAQEARRSPPSPRPANPDAPTFDPERVRPGRKDPWPDPKRVVDVEVFRVGFDLENPVDLVLLAPEERTLSCCLNLAWAPDLSLKPDEVARILRDLNDVFKVVARKTRASSSWSRDEAGRFEGWLSYPTASDAWEAFRTLHEALNGRGLGVNQWTREMFIPRSPK